jgi:SAM-dependent methyltransferase
MECGWTTPYILTQGECRQFWASRTDLREESGLADQEARSAGIMDFLAGFWFPEVDQHSSILEVGCGWGANLHHLKKLGYSDLTGVEISSDAVEMLRRTYPDLYSSGSVISGSAEEILPELGSDSVGVFLTVATSMHLHPKSSSVYREIARIAGKYICTVELESANNSYLFARNYGRLFEKLGCRKIKSIVLDRTTEPPVPSIFFGYTARLLEVG